MVKVSSALHSELTQIKDSGEVDMNDIDAVLNYAQNHHLSLAERMILGNSNRYLRCITDGMQITD